MKGFFRVTKGAVITALIIILSATLLGVGGARAFDQIAQNNSIGADAAANFAYLDAGVLPENAVLVKCSFDFEKGIFVYKVEFVADGVDYEYVVRASDGIILARDEEVIEGYRAQSETPADATQTQTAATQASVNGYIDVELAKLLALRRAGFDTVDDVRFTTAKLDDDDGKLLYEINFYAGGMEYEVDVDAVNGAVLSYSAEAETPVTPAVTQPAVTQPAQPAVKQPAQPSAPAQTTPAQPVQTTPVQPVVTPPAQPTQPAAPAQPYDDDDDDDDDYDDHDDHDDHHDHDDHDDDDD